MNTAILDRVRKLLALATSPNPHEAAVAAARAQELITRHRLEGWLAAAQGEASDPDPILNAVDEPLYAAKRVRKWKIALAAALADANGCACYVLTRATDEAIVLVGRGRDRAAVRVLWDGLLQRIEWLSATHGSGRDRAWHEGFRVGVVDAIAQRLDATSTEVNEGLDAAALAVVDHAAAGRAAALDEFLSRNLSLKKGRVLRVDARAWARGREAGASLPLP